MGTGITVTAKRDGVSGQLEIEQLTDDELHDLLKRAKRHQMRAYAFLLATWIRDSAKAQRDARSWHVGQRALPSVR